MILEAIKLKTYLTSLDIFKSNIGEYQESR